MANKKSWGIISVCTIAMLTTLFVGCSTFPSMTASATNGVSYSMLGYVGDSFETYAEAFAAAKKAYPTADAVVVVTGRADDLLSSKGHFFTAKIVFGYYAVKFKENDAAPKKFLGIF